MSLKVQEMKVLRTLERVFGVNDVEYNIMSKTFVYKKGDEAKDITFSSILRHLEDKDLTQDEKEVYEILDMLNSSYFPRRLKQLFENVYQSLDIAVPENLYISKKGIHIDEAKGFIVTYQDDWEEIVKELEEFYNKDIRENMNQIKFEDYKGEYHKK